MKISQQLIDCHVLAAKCFEVLGGFRLVTKQSLAGPKQLIRLPRRSVEVSQPSGLRSVANMMKLSPPTRPNAATGAKIYNYLLLTTCSGVCWLARSGQVLYVVRLACNPFM